MKSAKVSVLMPVCNGEPYLREAIDSILNQTLRDFELIIINDGSSDDSARTVRSYNDERIIFREQENKGLNPTLNRGIEMARAPLIARMDQDDIALPDRFALQLSWMEDHPEVGVLGTAVAFIDESGKPTGRKITRGGDHAELVKNILEFRSGVALMHPTVMMRRDVLLQAGEYNERFLDGDETHLWLNVSEISKLHVLDKILLCYRYRRRATTLEIRPLSIRNRILARTCYHLRRQGLPDPSIGPDEAWSEMNKLADEKMEKHKLLKVDRARAAISDALFATCGWRKCMKLAHLLVSKPELIPGSWSRRKLKCAIDETVLEMAAKLKEEPAA